jgi:beta-phosphoglucomutase-like phosphatase (HAD superfamily)
LTNLKFDAVLFDCDGVLVDSEPITNGVLRDMLEESGWLITPGRSRPLASSLGTPPACVTRACRA